MSHPKFACKILQKLDALRALGNFCDVDLLAGKDKQKIPAHRLVLAASSDFFHAMFMGSMLESREKQVILAEVHGNCLLLLVSYCYTGALHLHQDNVEQLLRAASFLQMDDAVDECCIFIKKHLSVSNCLGVDSLADQLSLSDLKQTTEGFISEFFYQVRQQDEFFQLDVGNMKRLIGSDDLTVSEESVFDGVMKWVQYEPKSRNHHIPQLMALVRLPHLMPTFLTDHVWRVCYEHHCMPLYNEALTWHQIPERNLKSKRIKPRNPLRTGLMLVRREDKNGFSIDMYSPFADVWSRIGKYPQINNLFAAVTYKEKIIFGLVGSSQSVFSIYDMKTNTVTPIEPIPKRDWSSTAVLKDILYVVGGNDGTNNLRTVKGFDLLYRKWINIAPMLCVRSSANAIVLNERLYAIGGLNDKKQVMKSVEAYDPVIKKWTQLASMIKERYCFGVAAGNGFLYAIGGKTFGTAQLNHVERYDPHLNVWITLCSLSVDRSNVSCAFLAERLFVVGGVASNGTYVNTVEEYDQKTNKWMQRTSLQGNVASPFLIRMSR